MLPKSQRRAYVGYEDGPQAVQYYNTETRKILTSQNYHFLELTQETSPPEPIKVIVPDAQREGEPGRPEQRDTLSTGGVSDAQLIHLGQNKGSGVKRKRSEQDLPNEPRKTRGIRADYRHLENPFSDSEDEDLVNAQGIETLGDPKSLKEAKDSSEWPEWEQAELSQLSQMDAPLQGQHQHSLIPVPSGYSHYAQPPIPLILPSSSSSELSYALVETPPPESRPISHSSITLPNLPIPSSPALKHEQFETLVGLTPFKTEYASDIDGQPFLPMTSLSTFPLSCELASHPKEGGQEDAHVFPTPAGTHGHPHHRPHANDLYRLQDPAMYLGHISPPPSKRRHPSPSLTILGQPAYSPGARNPTPHSSSFSSSDIGMPTSNVHLDTHGASSLQVPPPVLAPNPKAGQGVLKLPSRKRRRDPVVMACLFCRERKIACGALPAGSADPTCE
ncbi:hypothetical protein EDB86DRAFT_3084789 [Lactarius hatsudake]|nr:hypothetical protein EDB86DRAFT_3084789 [Lactarius hatsudake]